jgi:hypothetical protein
MSTHVVGYPKWYAVMAVGFLGVPAFGLHMAVGGRAGWTFWRAGLFVALDVWFLAYVLLYRSLFLDDAVEQRSFPGFVRRLPYTEIQRVKWIGAGRGGYALCLVPRYGRKMKIYGRASRLYTVRAALFEKIPHAFEH